jgi:beta-lactamase class A
MMTYLKRAENDPGYLQRTLTYVPMPEDELVIQDVLPEVELLAGKTYTVEDVVRKMVTYSDNRSMNLLARSIDSDTLWRVYSELGLPSPLSTKPEDDFMTVKEYASFFRVLYNASYLNPEMSELGLKILTEVKYTDGLAAGAPSSVAVAHKFGERRVGDAFQLHDCGIVYYPDHPYLLCVMSRGGDFKKLSTAIYNVARTVYTSFDQTNSGR